jgi:chemosensory pili system protein ChpA (sensor histidine kinase/response regulator)
MEPGAVKLLRRVDAEIRDLAAYGSDALRQPINPELIAQLLEAAEERDHASELMNGLREAVDNPIAATDSLAISGRQALSSAALTLREEIASIRDVFDLYVRADNPEITTLEGSVESLQQIGNTLSLLGFQSSRATLFDQVERLTGWLEAGELDQVDAMSIASVLLQVDENLSSIISGGTTEVERITTSAQKSVAIESRNGLELVKQSVMDFVSSGWDRTPLAGNCERIDAISGALDVIPLPRAARLLTEIRTYMDYLLSSKDEPNWEQLDHFADAISGVDYYLERVSQDGRSTASNVLSQVESSLAKLEFVSSEVDAVVDALDETQDVTHEPDAVDTMDAAVAELGSATIENAITSSDAQLDNVDPDDENIVLGFEAIDLGEYDFGDSIEPDEVQKARAAQDVIAASADFDAFGEFDEPAEVASTPAEPEVQVPVELAAAATAMAALTASAADNPALHDHFDADPDIAQIFVEEVAEVQDTLDEWLPQWNQNLEHDEALSELRRGFHTIKGSGRMVGANVIGEMAWGVENLLNRIVDNTITANTSCVELCERARALVPELISAYEEQRAPELSAVSLLLEQADVLASGGTLADDALLDDEQVEDAFVAEAAAVEKTIESTAEIDPVQEEHWRLFAEESRDHVAQLRAATSRGSMLLDDSVMSALHMLAGSAATVGATKAERVSRALNDLAISYRSHNLSPELTKRTDEFMAEATEQLADVLEYLSLSLPDPMSADGVEALAATSRELVQQIESEHPEAQTPLHALDSLDVLVDAKLYLADWHAGSANQAAAVQLPNSLTELTEQALAQGQVELAELAQAIAHAHDRLQGCELSAGNYETLQRAHEQLLVVLDCLAVNQAVPELAELLSAIALIDVAPEPVAVIDVPVETLSETPSDTPMPAKVVELASANASGRVAEEVDFEIDPEIIEVFFEEADELLEELDISVHAWQAERDNRLYLENLLRSLHTLKGGARLSGLLDLGDTTHQFESFLTAAQAKDAVHDDAFFEELQVRQDNLVATVEAVRGGTYVAPLAVESVDDQPAASANDVIAKVVALSPSAQEPEELPPMQAQMAALVDTQGAADVAPETRTGQEVVRVGASLLEELVSLAGESSIVRARIEQGMGDFTGALDEMETTIGRVREQLRRLEIETEGQVVFRQEKIDDLGNYEEFDPLEMDRYSQLQQLSRALTESASDMLELKETLLFRAREAETLLMQQARINTELQEGLMRTRMVPFSRLLPRLRRIVRQIAGEVGKGVEFNAYNVEGELDRNLLERMVPPLEHMLRNAVDHGIETAEARRGYGKPDIGRIDLRLSREGGDVMIEIADDGAGIDVETVREKAIERGLMSADADLRDDEVMQFILAPGFSTAKSITQISGRGVGMDVVHSEVKQLGGSINIMSKPGRGTRFVLRVPFTVSVNRALMVSVGEDLYAIPLNTIEGIVLLGSQELEKLYADESTPFEYAGASYAVRYLGNFLGREYRGVGQQGSAPVVLVRSGDQSIAVHVDSVQGSREIVVKSLGPQFAGLGGISGATILGDGSVVVILDLLALIRARSEKDMFAAKRTSVTRTRAKCVMVVDDSVTVRKVTTRLLERQGMDVMVAKDGVEAVALLQERRPDIMLLDIEMPRMDGFEVARQVRRDEDTHELPIVMISSRTGGKHQERATKLGVNRFLGKPFQEAELISTIEELVK